MLSSKKACNMFLKCNDFSWTFPQILFWFLLRKIIKLKDTSFNPFLMCFA